MGRDGTTAGTAPQPVPEAASLLVAGAQRAVAHNPTPHPHCPRSLPETPDQQELRQAQGAHPSVTEPKDTRGHWLDHCLSKKEGASPGWGGAS